MYAHTIEHPIAIAVTPGPGIAPQISYHIRDMIGRVLRESPKPMRSADAKVTICYDSPDSQCCTVVADVDIDGALLHLEANGVNARQAVDQLETGLRDHLGDPKLVITPN